VLNGRWRHLGYLGIFLAGLVAVTLLPTAVLDKEHMKSVGPLVLIAYILAFCYWTRRREAALLTSEALHRSNRIAGLAISGISVSAGLVILWIFYPLLPQMWVHPFVALVTAVPVLVGAVLVVWGISGIVKAWRERAIASS
jgi:hypothetical protein